MLKISAFSKLGQVTIKALRLYDQMGLLKPAHIDNFTNYRYYSAEQLPRLNRILAFKDLGFSLEQINKLLDANLTPAEIRGMLRLKQAELQRLLQEEQERLWRVEARLNQIEQENTMSNYEVVLKKVEPVKVVSVRDVVPDFKAVPSLYQELAQYLTPKGLQEATYCAGIWHDPAYKESDIDWEAVASFTGLLPTKDERFKIYELSGVEKAACTVHHGSYNTINKAYTAVLSWIENNSYKPICPNREVYIVGGSNQDDESYITEIQFPIEKLT